MPRRTVFKDDSDDEDNVELFGLTEYAGEEIGSSQVKGPDDELADDLIDSDSDEAPQDVSFSTGKEDALRQVQTALRQMEGEMRNKKLKRRQKDELYRLQKKQKLQDLASRKLPDEFLADISSQPTQVKTSKIQPSQDNDGSGATSDDSGLSDDADNEEDTEDYISLGNDRLAGFKVVAIQEDLKKRKPSSQTAAEFRQNMLFGSRVNREPMQAKLAKRSKKKAQFRSK